VGTLKNDLLHLSDPTFADYWRKFQHYTDLDAKEIKEKNLAPGIKGFVDYVFIKPLWWFLKTYIRHKGFMDSWQGFLFSFFSSLRFPVSYFKAKKL